MVCGTVTNGLARGEAPRLYPPEADGLQRDWGAKPR